MTPPALSPRHEALLRPWAPRTPVGYDSGFVSSYTPNQSSLLPPQLATDLYNAGRSQDQQPAGTYAPGTTSHAVSRSDG